MGQFFKNILLQISDGLEKSTVGTMIMFGCFGLIAYLTFKEGGSDTVDDLITTSMIVAAALLGVNSVADIFKVNKSSTTVTSKGQCGTSIPPETSINQTEETYDP